MSEYMVCKTEMHDMEAIMASLEAMGITKDQVEVHDSPVNLYGYGGDRRKQKAHIVIRRQHVGSASNDIGFEKQAEGGYSAHVSAYDRNVGLGKKIWSGQMKQYYSRSKILKSAKRKGWKTSVEEKDGKIRIQVFPR